MNVIKMSSEAFQKGYADGSLGIYDIHMVGKTRFRAYSESGKVYKGSTINNRVILIPDNGTPMLNEVI